MESKSSYEHRSTPLPGKTKSKSDNKSMTLPSQTQQKSDNPPMTTKIKRRRGNKSYGQLPF